jgi:hypothetical protein
LLLLLFAGSRTGEIRNMKHEHLVFRCPLLQDPEDQTKMDKTLEEHLAHRNNTAANRAMGAFTPWLTLALLSNQTLFLVLPNIRYYVMTVPKSKEKGNKEALDHTTVRPAMHTSYCALDALYLYVIIMRLTLKVSTALCLPHYVVELNTLFWLHVCGWMHI